MCTPPALAQRPRPDRPYRGLFGGNGANPNSTQQFDLNISLSGAFDDNVLASIPQGGGDPRFQQSGGYGSGTISLDYTKRAGRATFDFTGGTSYRYYSSSGEMNGFNSSASIGLTAHLSPSTDLRMTESGSYSPFYSFVSSAGMRPPVPGQIAPINPDYPLTEEPAVSAYSSASIDRRLTSRSSLSADYSFFYTDYRSLDLPYRIWGAGVRYSYRLSVRADLNVRYHFERGFSGLYYANQSIDTHGIDLGFSYTRQLSPLRRMTFGFTIGPSAYEAFVPVGAPTNQEWQRIVQYPVRGNVYLTRQIARSWSVGVDYSRALRYTQGFTDPFFSDFVTASLNGFVAERARLTFSAGYDTGSVGVGIGGRGYDTATVAANYQVALTRWAALFVNYGYYHYLFDQSVPIAAALSRGQDRHSISIGMNLWAPLLR